MTQKDSSVLFSLQELMTLEKDRVRAEEDLERRAEEAMLRQQREDEARRLAAEEARLRDAEERRRRDEQRAREESARLDAIRQAEVERARLEAESAGRLEQLKRQQAHEKELATLHQDRGKKRLRIFAFSAVALLFVALTAGGVVIKTQSDRQHALEGQLASLEGDRASLKARLDIATTPEARAELQRQMDEKDNAIKALQAIGTAPTIKATSTQRVV
ncbi:MAG TPA: hypothetical protein VF316_01135, partial [Polyangiaceae bacterium]